MVSHLTPRQQEILERLEKDKTPREIGEELGISRNAVYQQIQRMRRAGALPEDYTPSGAPPREERVVKLAMPNGSALGAGEVATLARTLAAGDPDGEIDATKVHTVALAELQDIAQRLQNVTSMLTYHFLRT